MSYSTTPSCSRTPTPTESFRTSESESRSPKVSSASSRALDIGDSSNGSSDTMVEQEGDLYFDIPTDDENMYENVQANSLYENTKLRRSQRLSFGRAPKRYGFDD